MHGLDELCWQTLHNIDECCPISVTIKEKIDRNMKLLSVQDAERKRDGGGWIRTNVSRRSQIYSHLKYNLQQPLSTPIKLKNKTLRLSKYSYLLRFVAC